VIVADLRASVAVVILSWYPVENFAPYGLLSFSFGLLETNLSNVLHLLWFCDGAAPSL
jgi:hypothetical protein